MRQQGMFIFSLYRGIIDRRATDRTAILSPEYVDRLNVSDTDYPDLSNLRVDVYRD